MRSHYAKEALSLTNRPRNRYRNIIPYQQSIFKFQNSALYFNASRVLQGRAISCQGPLENEHAHFWRMVWESNTTAIVMLTDLDEKGVNKCSWYLPTGTEAKLPPKSDLPKELEITVTQTDGPPKPTSASTSDSFEFFQRRIELYYKDEKRTVVHYHLRGWHDFTAAPHATLANLVKRVWDNHFSKGEHIISHCSAGIGRSGTFLAILGALSELQNTPLLTNLVINIVTKLRSFNDGREGMVQTAEQYGLIFKTLAVLDANCAREFCVQTSF
ncbi:MAG TPA: tyrosine-protein phosphatase [Rhabdochlamydiaceae bacterium]|jgi:protein tyrosine phosphatase|nr:tyrosine-protein phosphatase [Rhabdochlamydiaceae bacterium]